MTSDQVIRIAEAEIGVCENPPKSNNVKYNTWYYGHEMSGPSYPWCATFISWVFRGTGLIKKTASCMEMAQWFRDQGRWSRTAEPGDVVFYKYGTNNRWTNHVGLVTKVSGNTIYAIEGNTSNSSKGSQDNGGEVALKKRTSKIVGYGRPDYADAKPLTDHPTLKKGSKGPYVKELQGILNQKGASLDVDGSFGSKTLEAVKAYQGAHSLKIDGVVGALTWNSLLN